MIVVDAGEVLKEIANKTYREYYYILMKRFMMKVSEKIAEEKLKLAASIYECSSEAMLVPLTSITFKSTNHLPET